MAKRLLALLLCAFILLSVLPVTAFAADNEGQKIVNQISSTYGKILSATGTEDMAGYCGLMSSYQLYFLGVDKYMNAHNGKDEFDAYKDLTVTTGGHRVNAYSAQEYTLEQALNAITHNGTRNAYNILLGFHSTTTEEGSLYGHASVIHAIIDGTVYFMENFDSAIGGAEGTPIKCSIARIAQFYSDWTSFEGAVEFGQKPYTYACESFGTSLFVQAQQDTQMLSQPCLTDCQEVYTYVMRSVLNGERLEVTGLYRNPQGLFFYEVIDCGTVGYVPAEQMRVMRVNYEDVTARGVDAPNKLEPGQDAELTGKVYAGSGELLGVSVVVSDAGGEKVLSWETEAKGSSLDLQKSDVNKALDLGALPEGAYTYEIFVSAIKHVLEDGQVTAQPQTCRAWHSQFCVGQAAYTHQEARTASAQIAPNGWQYEKGHWYYYRNGSPATGWLQDRGMAYYLKENGAAATGWNLVEGKLRFFTDTGALRTGWMETKAGTYYLTEHGEAVTGWQEVEEKRYYFTPEGRLCSNGWLETEEGKYFLMPDGQPVTGWVTLAEGRFCFHKEDGRLLAEAVEIDGSTYMRVPGEMGDTLAPRLNNHE